MNCKPGDLAYIASTPPLLRYLLGRVVRVTRSLVDGGDLCWEYEGTRLRTPMGSPIDLIEDEFLRPIRGDGVTDDEVRELYAPKIPEVV